MPDDKWVSKANLQTFWQMIRSKVLPNMVGDTVTSWLNEHVTPAGSAVVVDDSLTIQGAAADAKKTGDEISGLKEDFSNKTVMSRDLIPSGADANEYKTPGVYSVTTDAIAQTVANLPVMTSCELIVFNSRGSHESYGYGNVQITVTSTDTYFRVWKNSRWFDWIKIGSATEIAWVNNNLNNFNEFSLTKNISQPYHTDRTNNGIRFVCPLSDGFLKWYLDGTATAAASATVYSGTLSKVGLTPGNVYHIDMDDFPTGVMFQIRFGTSAGNRFLAFTHSQYFVVPSNATDTLLIQIIVAADTILENAVFTMPGIYKVNNADLDEFQTWFARGVILTDGTISTSDSRIYTPDIMSFDSDTIVSFDDTRGVQVMYYDADGNIITDRNTYGWMDTGANYVVITGGDRFRLNIKLVPNAAQTNEQVTETLEHVHIYSISKKMLEDYKNYDDEWASLSMYQTISVIGDSYASGVTNNYPMSWGQIMARDIGATLINLSHGGAYTKTWLTNNSWGLPKMLSDPPQQLYICAMGINDYTRIKNNEYTLGTIADIHDDPELNPDTFYGNYGKIISNIKTHSPNASIVMLSVARPYERVMDVNIKEIAEHFEIPYVYLPNDWFFRSQYFRGTMYADHPRAYGYSGMAKAIRRLLEKAIKDNASYFANYTGITE